MYQKTNFFLGSNTKYGFMSRFNEIQTPQIGELMFILKGGAGCGKSTFMKKIAEEFSNGADDIEFIPCASDPGSLDGIIMPKCHFAMVDGTSPHVMEPVYPGIYEIIIPLGDAMDNAKLSENYSQIVSLGKEISQYHKNASAFIKSAGALIDNSKNIAKSFLNSRKINNFADEFMKQLSGCAHGEKKVRLLSAVSVGKIEYFSDTIRTMCDKIYVINDDFGALKDDLLRKIADKAEYLKLEHIQCPCSVMGDNTLDHIIFPSVKMAITTSNKFHKFDNENANYIFGLQNFDENSPEYVSALSQISFAQLLIENACDNVLWAKKRHDVLEKIYANSMDFSIVEQMRNNVIAQIKNLNP